jgi:hypothetical protein
MAPASKLWRRKMSTRILKVATCAIAWAGRAAFAAVLFLELTSAVVAQPSTILSQKSDDAAQIISVAQQRGHVRVVVQFESPVSPNGFRPDPATVANVKARVAAAQNSIIAAQFGSASNPREGQGFARGIHRFDITPGFAVNVTQQELEALAANPNVIRIQHDRPDPPTLLQSVPLIGMTNAYAAGATGQGQAVAVLDTGVQANHEFLSGKVVAEACFSNAAGNGGAVTLCPNQASSQGGAGSADPNTTQCINGATNLCLHGTHVAGIAAGNNTSLSTGEPTNGVATSGKIVAVQIFTRFNDTATCNSAGTSPPCVLTFLSDQISGLNYVLSNINLPGNIKIASVNMSLGGGSNTSACDSDTRKPPIDNLRAAGVLTAIAAGNDGFKSAVGAPGCISTAITVGSTDKSDVISSFSNMSSVVDLMAPGGFGSPSNGCTFGANNNNILGPVATATGSTTGYACLAGTSMATPHVAGAIAALRTACPSATAATIENALKNTGTPITDNRSGGTQTKPRIRVDLAVQQLGCAAAANNDNFANAIVIQSGQTLTASNAAATRQAGEPTILGNPGGHSEWWSWTATTSGTVTISTVGSDFDTLLGVYTGSAVNALTLVAQNDDAIPGGSDLTSFVTFTAVAGTTYFIAVDGFNGATGTIVLTLSLGVKTSDFNSDGKSDILWRHDTGPVSMWVMNGAQPISQVGVTNSIPTSWQIVGLADFNGDGKNDFLWRYTDGSVAMWLMNGAQPISQVGVTNSIPTSWQIVGTGDFNGDGKSDILWRYTDGSLAMWLMNGAQPISQVGLGNLATSWQIAGVGDFNGDGKSDILWRHTDGTVAMWLMNGAQPISQVGFGSLATSWQIAGVGDFNGDGKSDILWRHTDGTVAMWLMNGAQPISQVGVASVPTDWQIVGLGDFNGDGKSDFLWRYTDGTAAMWLMNGAQPISQVGVTSIPNEWKILGVATGLPVAAPPGPAFPPAAPAAAPS